MRHLNRQRLQSSMPDTAQLSPEGEGATILCIDDDPGISETIALRLQPYDVEVLCAYHGMHGLSIAKTQRPDLIITDVRMPQGGGDYVIECLRNSSGTKDIPIIVLTGRQDSCLNAVTQRLGIEIVFTKPVRFSDLASAIKWYLPLGRRKLHASKEI